MKTFITVIVLVFAFSFSVKAQETLIAKTNCIHRIETNAKSQNVISLYDWAMDIETKYDIKDTNDLCYESFIHSNDKAYSVKNQLDFKNSAIPLSKRNKASSNYKFNYGSNLDLNYGLDFRINI